MKIIEINQTGTYRKIFTIIRTHLKVLFNIQDPVTEKTEDQNMEQKYDTKKCGLENEYDDDAYVNR